MAAKLLSFLSKYFLFNITNDFYRALKRFYSQFTFNYYSVRFLEPSLRNDKWWKRKSHRMIEFLHLTQLCERWKKWINEKRNQVKIKGFLEKSNCLILLLHSTVNQKFMFHHFPSCIWIIHFSILDED